MRLLVVRNPIAGRRNPRLLDGALDALERAGAAVRVVDTAAAGDARRIATELAADSCDAFVVAGGDGTINEAVEGAMARPDGFPPLGIVPLGTANVLAREIALPMRPAALAAALLAGRTRPLRPGVARSAAGTRHFALMAGVGFDARVVAGVTAALKKRLGKGAYVWRSAVETFRRRPLAFGVDIDGTTARAASVIVSRARLYAGPYLLAPDADLGGETLHVCLFERGGPFAPLLYGAALVGGLLPRAPGFRIVEARRVRVAAVAADGEEPAQIDGDGAGGAPFEFSVADKTIRLIVA